jgi:hypothetical protein
LIKYPVLIFWIVSDFKKKHYLSQALWLTPAILATQEAEIKRVVVLGQPRQKVHKIPSQLIKKQGAVVHAFHPSYKEGINRRIIVQPTLPSWA